jgi:hypothetical protein
VAAYKARVLLLQALVSGCPAIAPVVIVVVDEFAEVTRSRRVAHPRRRRLLQVLHSTRALDSTLREFVRFHNCGSGASTLGGYLTDLSRHKVATINRLPGLSRSRFVRSVVNIRNRFMHTAGAFPSTEIEVDMLLSEMHDCVVEVLAL